MGLLRHGLFRRSLELPLREGPIAPRLPVDPIAEARKNWMDEGWEGAADGMAAVTSVMRVHQILLARVDEQLGPLDLTFARYEVLMLLFFSRRGSLPLSLIGERLQVHPTSVTNAVQRLDQQGLVERRGHPTDRRAKLAILTEAGRNRALAASERLNRTVFSDPGLSRANVKRLLNLLREVRKGAGDY